MKTMIGLILGALIISSVSAQVTKLELTVEKAKKLAKKNSLQLEQINNEYTVQQQKARELTRWESPEVTLRFDSKVSRELNEKKTELNSITVSQQLPVGSFFSARRLQNSLLAQAKYKKTADILNINYDIETLFLDVQYKKMILDLAQEKIDLVKTLGRAKSKKVVYVTTNLDAKRLDIIKNDVSLDYDHAIVDFRSSVLQLKSSLRLQLDTKISFDKVKARLYILDIDQHYYFKQEDV